ncbi:MAG TPA: CARDB domain-containing protein, partial [Gaiellaceae bacterium]|nr:CARDB domain-containing protein [Gaiellaceae bacterium]
GLVLAQDPAGGTEVDAGSAVSLTISAGPLPDLAIRIDEVTDDCTGGSCTTRVSFTVSNLSEGLVAGPFEVTVDAEGSDAVTVEVDGLGPREVRKLTAESSGSCFDPDCFVAAEVDSGGDVEETNEENNAAEFSVIG